MVRCVTNTAATTPVVLTVSAANTGATSGDATVDITATSTNGLGIVEIQADDNINVGTDAAAVAVAVGNNTGATGVVINSGTEQVVVDGVTYYGKSAGLPVATVGGFADGDKYYDTDLDMEMRYDATRAKWLSVEAMYVQFGRNGFTAVSQYYRGIDGRVMSATLGYHMPYNGVVVGLGYTRDDSDAATFDVMASGVSVETLASAAVSGRDNAMDGDIDQGEILAVMNQAGGNITSEVMGWVKVKWRVDP